MKNKILFTFFLFSKVLFSQGLEIEWEKNFEIFDGALGTHSVVQTYDNGYLMMNNLKETSESTFDYWIIKTDNLGNIEWEKILGGSESDFACCVVTHNDGTHLVGGNTYSEDGDVENNNGSSDIWILKLDENGDILWQKTYGENNQDFLSHITKTTDGGYILGGGSIGNNNGGRDVWLIKIDSYGEIEWSKKYGFESFDDTVKIRQTTDGGYIVGAITSSNNQYDFWILKINSAGEIQWSKIMGGTQPDEISDIQQLPDGGFIVGGRTLSNDEDIPLNYGMADILLVRFNASGEILWIKNFGGSDEDKYPSIQITNSGTILITAYSLSNDFDLENNGEGSAWNFELDVEGNILWSEKLEGYGPSSFEKTFDDGFVLLSRPHDNTEFILTKFQPFQGVLNLVENDMVNSNITVYPNPSKGHIIINSLNNLNIIEVKVYDISGKYLHDFSFNSSNVEINLDFLKSGVYFIEISQINGKQIKKIIVK